MRTLLSLLILLAATGCAVMAQTPDPADSAADDAGYGGSLGGDDTSVADSPYWSGDDSAPPSPPPGDDASSPDTSTGPKGPPFDAGPDGVCPHAPSPGDLRIDELMIESVAGAGDYGQWLEVESTLGCALDLRGLHGECPHASKVRTFDIVADVWLEPHGTFLVADSSNPAINHELPGTVVVWFGQPGDVLRKKGDTVTLSLEGTIVDTLTYPALALTVGASVAFPRDCAPEKRSGWSNWQTSQSSWFPGFLGTPNAPNTDVHCP